MKTYHRINKQIKSRQIRLIDETGVNIGIVYIDEALRIAESKGYDLVEVSPAAVPPVCRIMDYGKYRYELKKKERIAKKAHKKIELKELRLRILISPHDLETKVNRAREFLKNGDKVKFNVIFQGREITLLAKGKELLSKCIEYLKDISIIEKPINQEGRVMFVVLSPQKHVTKGGSNAEIKNAQNSVKKSESNGNRKDQIQSTGETTPTPN